MVCEEGSAPHSALDTYREIGLDSRLGGSPERNKALFSPFAQNADQPPFEIHFGKVEPGQLRSIGFRSHRAARSWPGSRRDRLSFSLISASWERSASSRREGILLSSFGDRSARAGFLCEDAFSAEEAKVRPQGGELASR